MNKTVREAVFARDGGCMAPILDPGAGPCGSAGGYMLAGRATTAGQWVRLLEYNHITEGYGTLGQRAEDRVDQGITVCGWHHRGSRSGVTWATSRKAKTLIRAHLARLYPGRAEGEGRASDVVRRVRTAQDHGGGGSG